jgi:YVTN family beta-propeller protein
LTPDEQRLVVVNREANSVSIIRVKNNQGNDVANKLAEIGVGEEPRCVAISPEATTSWPSTPISRATPSPSSAAVATRCSAPGSMRTGGSIS